MTPDSSKTFAAPARLSFGSSSYSGTTGEHGAGTPLDEVPVAGAALEALLDTYATYTHHVAARAGDD